jgi:alkanesulfonate monooxygenase SsuD/methylene tetrahydromethanopterin reductase-like flavin-dependent oxidoreductase (luciferase family)
VRQFGVDKEIAARIFVCPTPNADAVRRIARFSLAVYLAAPAYRAQQEWLGNAPLLKASWERMAAGDFKGARAALPDEVVDRYYIHGSPEYCRERIAEYHAAGVDTPIIGLIEAGIDARAAIRALAPR